MTPRKTDHGAIRRASFDVASVSLPIDGSASNGKVPAAAR
jgi:hypothetical protein